VPVRDRSNEDPADTMRIATNRRVVASQYTVKPPRAVVRGITKEESRPPRHLYRVGEGRGTEE